MRVRRGKEEWGKKGRREGIERNRGIEGQKREDRGLRRRVRRGRIEG